MQLTIATASILALAYARFASAAMSIDTPAGLVQCQPSLLAWHEGTAPYWLTVVPGGQPGANPLKSFDATTDMSHTWVVDIPSGTLISLQLKDASGAVAYSDRVTIQGSPDSTCLDPAAAQASPPAAPATPPANGSSGPPPAASAAPPANGSSASPAPPAPASQQPAGPAVSSPAPQAPAPPASRPTGSQAAAASSSAKPSSGAVRTSVVNGFAGLLAVLGVALF